MIYSALISVMVGSDVVATGDGRRSSSFGIRQTWVGNHLLSFMNDFSEIPCIFQGCVSYLHNEINIYCLYREKY
jgi:acetaldehyde dehydrogenase (acetylating)